MIINFICLPFSFFLGDHNMLASASISALCLVVSVDAVVCVLFCRCLLLKWTDELLIEVNSNPHIMSSSVFVSLMLATVTTGILI